MFNSLELSVLCAEYTAFEISSRDLISGAAFCFYCTQERTINTEGGKQHMEMLLRSIAHGFNN